MALRLTAIGGNIAAQRIPIGSIKLPVRHGLDVRKSSIYTLGPYSLQTGKRRVGDGKGEKDGEGEKR